MIEDECIVCCENVIGSCIRCLYPVCNDHLFPKTHGCDKRILHRCLICRVEFGEYLLPPHKCVKCKLNFCQEDILNICKHCFKKNN